MGHDLGLGVEKLPIGKGKPRKDMKFKSFGREDTRGIEMWNIEELEKLNILGREK